MTTATDSPNPNTTVTDNPPPKGEWQSFQPKPGTIPPFDVMDDTSELVLPVPRHEPTQLLRFLFNRADEAKIERLVNSIISETLVEQRGLEEFRYSEDRAYADHFDEIIAEAHIQPYGVEDSEEQPLSADRIKKLNVEVKAEAVKLLYNVDVSVKHGGDDTSFLFEDEALMVATVKVGDPKRPNFVFDILYGRPGGERRMRYRDDVARLQTQREGKKSRRKVVTDIKFGVALFKEKFRGVKAPGPEGGGILMADRLYEDTDADKKSFLRHFNRLWMVAVSDAVVASFQEAVRD